MVALVNSICHSDIRLSIEKCKLTSLDELLEHIDKYIIQEEFEMTIRDDDSRRIKFPLTGKGRDKNEDRAYQRGIQVTTIKRMIFPSTLYKIMS